MHHSKDVLNSFAKLASDAFLGKSKTAMNDSIQKIAQEEGLSPAQVEYVTSQANNGVWSKLFPMNKQASYDFPLADASVIIEKLQIKDKPVIKQASLDYLAPPQRFVYEKVATGCVDEGVDKSPAKRREIKKELERRLEKAAQAQEEISMKIMQINTSIDNYEKEFVKQARELVMQTPFSDRAESMLKIAEFVRSSVDADINLGQRLMKKLASTVKSQGLVKEADLKAPEEYISDKLPAKIINGRHALYITIQTIKEKHCELDPYERGKEIVDSSLPILKEKIRAL